MSDEPKILLEYTPEELRALIDVDFHSPHYIAALKRSERALEIEEGSCGFVRPRAAKEARKGSGA